MFSNGRGPRQCVKTGLLFIAIDGVVVEDEQLDGALGLVAYIHQLLNGSGELRCHGALLLTESAAVDSWHPAASHWRVTLIDRASVPLVNAAKTLLHE